MCSKKSAFSNVSSYSLLMVMAAFLGMLTGCDEEPVQTYTVPKGSENIVGIDKAEPENTSTSSIWRVPPNWRQATEKRRMREATFLIDHDGSEIEVAVSKFPGNVGGLLANVNRWRGQVGLPKIEETDLHKDLHAFDNGGFTGHTMHLAGESQHMLSAIISERDANQTWFVKVTTSPEAAEKFKSDVFAFARSFGNHTSDTTSSSESNQ